MVKNIRASGYFPNDLPYKRSGYGPRPLVIIQGLTFSHKPQAVMLMMYKFLENDYMLYGVLRKPNLPQGYTLGDMADDYADMIRQEFGGPVDLIGISTGGSIALSFAADHPDLVRRLVIHSSAYKLNENAKQLQMDVARLAQNRQWTKAGAPLVGIPMHLEQTGNLSLVTRQDAGLMLSKWDLNQRSLGRALERLLHDASLRQNMLRLKALQDQVDGPSIAAREIVNFLGASSPNIETMK